MAAAQLQQRIPRRRQGHPSFALLASQETGLTEDQVEEKLQQFGANEVAHEKAPAWYVQLLQAFINPFIGILIVIAIVSLITDVFLAAPEDRDYKTLIVVCIMVMLSSLLRFWQEFRSNLAAEQLKSMVKTTATVPAKNQPRAWKRTDAAATRTDANSVRQTGDRYQGNRPRRPHLSSLRRGHDTRGLPHLSIQRPFHQPGHAHRRSPARRKA